MDVIADMKNVFLDLISNMEQADTEIFVGPVTAVSALYVLSRSILGEMEHGNTGIVIFDQTNGPSKSSFLSLMSQRKVCKTLIMVNYEIVGRCWMSWVLCRIKA